MPSDLILFAKPKLNAIQGLFLEVNVLHDPRHPHDLLQLPDEGHRHVDLRALWARDATSHQGKQDILLVGSLPLSHLDNPCELLIQRYVKHSLDPIEWQGEFRPKKGVVDQLGSCHYVRVVPRLKLLLEKLGDCGMQSQLLKEVRLSGIRVHPLLYLAAEINLTQSWVSKLSRIGHRGPPLIPNKLFNVFVDLFFILHVLVLQKLSHLLPNDLFGRATLLVHATEHLAIICSLLRGSGGSSHELELVLLLDASRSDNQ